MEQAPQQIIDWIKYYSQGLPKQFLIGNLINPIFLPSYVDDVVEFNNFASLPVPGETGKIYVTTSDNKQYRWSGSTYIDLTLSNWSKTGNTGTNPVNDFLGTTDAQPLIFRTNNIESARIFGATRNWNIGGITDNGFKFEVTGESKFRSITLNGLNNGGGSAGSAILENSNYDLLITNSLSGGAKFRFFPFAGDIYFDNTLNTGNQIFRTGNAVEAMRIWNNQNISIGTATNGGRLYVQAQGTLSTDNVFRIRNSANNANILNITGDGHFLFTGSHTLLGSSQIWSNGTRGYSQAIYSHTSDYDSLYVATHNNAGGNVQRSAIRAGYGPWGAIRFTETPAGSGFKRIGINFLPEYGNLNNSFEHVGLEYNLTNIGSGRTYAVKAVTGDIHIGAGKLLIGTVTEGARLYIKAQGTLSTDNVFRIRNNADSGDILNITGNGQTLFSGKVTVNGGFGSGIDLGSTSTGNQTITFLDWGGIAGSIGHTYQNNPGYALNPISQSFNIFAGGISGGSLGSPKINNIVATHNWGNTYPSQTEGGWHIHFAESIAAVTTATRAFKITPDRRAFWYNKTGDVVVGDTDSATLYSEDITAGNAALHTRTENGAIIKLYQEDTSITSASFISPISGSAVLTETDTFDGYTIGQVVKALRNQGLLQ